MIRLCVEVCICVGGEDKRKKLGGFRALTENDVVVATGAAVQTKTEALVAQLVAVFTAAALTEVEGQGANVAFNAKAGFTKEP